MEVTLNHYLLIGAVMFVSGVVCMATKRNGIAVLMGVELVLNGANVNFVAFAHYTNLGLDGQVVSLFVIVLAAAEAGATAIIQPGGSIRDDEVVAAADEHGLAMVFTGMRHFRH